MWSFHQLLNIFDFLPCSSVILFLIQVHSLVIYCTNCDKYVPSAKNGGMVMPQNQCSCALGSCKEVLQVRKHVFIICMHTVTVKEVLDLICSNGLYLIITIEMHILLMLY